MAPPGVLRRILDLYAETLERGLVVTTARVSPSDAAAILAWVEAENKDDRHVPFGADRLFGLSILEDAGVSGDPVLGLG